MSPPRWPPTLASLDSDRLSEVHFVWESIELRFGDSIVRFVVDPKATSVGASRSVSELELTRALRDLIGSRVQAIDTTADTLLLLRFEGGVEIRVDIEAESDEFGERVHFLERIGGPVAIV